VAFEVAVGRNGVLWVDSGSVRETTPSSGRSEENEKWLRGFEGHQPVRYAVSLMRCLFNCA
jgi:exosome complex RNA-binding protein Rrp4